VSELSEKELLIQVYLASRELEFSNSYLKFIFSRIENRKTFIKLRKLETARRFELTPQEELFIKFFNEELKLIHNMQPLELEAHREELAKIAFEARARLGAVDKKKRESKARVWEPVLNDELKSDAINRLKSGKLTKEERLLQNLIKLGMTEKEAQEKLSAGRILSSLKENPPEKFKSKSPINFVNPFSKPEEKPEEVSEVTIIEETNTVIISEVKEESKEKPSFVNPFAKS
jgi:hypothetical protein